MIRLRLSREDALYLLDALNTERFRIQDRAAEAFSNREPDGQWLYRLGVLDSLTHVVSNEINMEFDAMRPDEDTDSDEYWIGRHGE